jgi:hypothetical protein
MGDVHPQTCLDEVVGVMRSVGIWNNDISMYQKKKKKSMKKKKKDPFDLDNDSDLEGEDLDDDDDAPGGSGGATGPGGSATPLKTTPGAEQQAENVLAIFKNRNYLKFQWMKVPYECVQLCLARLEGIAFSMRQQEALKVGSDGKKIMKNQVGEICLELLECCTTINPSTVVGPGSCSEEAVLNMLETMNTEEGRPGQAMMLPPKWDSPGVSHFDIIWKDNDVLLRRNHTKPRELVTVA